MAATFLAFRKEIWGPLPKRRALGLRCGGRILGREKRWLLGQSVARSVGQVAMLNARITTCGRARPVGGRAGGRAAKEEVELESADMYNYRRGSRGGLRESEVLRAERSCHRHREIEETS